jgi:AraC-like DNA-binding protein
VQLSPFHMIRVFSRTMGISPYAYLDQLRVLRGQALLSKGWSISHAAYAAGFSDQSHFTRHFKRVLGLTPGLYVRGLLVGRNALAAAAPPA